MEHVIPLHLGLQVPGRLMDLHLRFRPDDHAEEGIQSDNTTVIAFRHLRTVENELSLVKIRVSDRQRARSFYRFIFMTSRPPLKLKPNSQCSVHLVRRVSPRRKQKQWIKPLQCISHMWSYRVDLFELGLKSILLVKPKSRRKGRRRRHWKAQKMDNEAGTETAPACLQQRTNGHGIGEHESSWIVITWGWGHCNCFRYNIGEHDVKKVTPPARAHKPEE